VDAASAAIADFSRQPEATTFQVVAYSLRNVMGRIKALRSIPNITFMPINLGSMHLPLTAATKTFAKISLCLRVCAPVLCSL
jgi:hypothetical protein